MTLIFRCYIDQDGRDVIKDWYHASDGTTRAEIVGVILQLEQNSRAQSNRTLFKKLTKRSSSQECVGFHEVLIDFEDRIQRNRKHHYRIIGYLDGEIFTMLLAFYKNENGRYRVPCQTAQERQREVTLDRRRATGCEFPPA